MDLISDQGLRIDGRRPNELRKINCKLGVFTQPTGSAYLEQGNTKVLAAVYGPHQIRWKRMKSEKCLVQCQYSMATFSANKRKKKASKTTSIISDNLKNLFQNVIHTDLYPDSEIDIFLEVLQADGGNFAACVNAASLALIDAGIPLTEYAIGCTASLGNGNEPLMDVNYLEECRGSSHMTLVLMPISGKVAFWDISGEKIHADHIEGIMEEAKKGCQEIYHILDRAVKLYLQETDEDDYAIDSSSYVL